eukprot:GSChrysophyteH1.ASY1.ANO1.1806.1 assembled CDS
MKYIAAYALCVVGGNATPDVNDIVKVIQAAGGEADEDAIGTLIGDMAGKDIHELLAAGEEKVKGMGGGSGGGSADAADTAEAAAPAAPAEEEVDALDGGMDMFGGGGGGGDY